MTEKTKKLTFAAAGTGILVICSWITVPFTVPFTLQTFAVFLLLNFLGGKLGTASIAVYILMGVAGLPVFSGFTGGIGRILGPTGGYIIGFLLSGTVYILFEKHFCKSFASRMIISFTALIICYAAGTVWFVSVYNTTGSISFGAALMSCVVPFIIPDAIKLVLADFVGVKLKRILLSGKDNIGR